VIPLKLSVIMPVYNAEMYLDQSIQSILNQTFRDFEFIILNDGSTDRSLEIIEKYRNIDNRIVLISRENKGLVVSLNELIEESRGKYIARMDSDDISLPYRFESQLNKMSKGYDLVGGGIIKFGDEGFIFMEYPSYLLKILIAFIRSNPFAHPAVMYSRDIVVSLGGYHHVDHAEDLDLWIRFLDKNVQMTNLEIPVLMYRIHPQQVSERYKVVQINTARHLRKKIFKSVFNYLIASLIGRNTSN
jgi:glycosyltransferase involved in cell wall biosynthesis